MENIPQKIIVKRLATAWLDEKIRIKNFITPNTEKSLAYRYALEFCGLTLNEIIGIGNAENIDEYIDSLFSNS